MKIVKLKKMTNGRYKLTMDNDSSMILYEEIILKNNLFPGKEIDIEKQQALFDENYKVTPYHQALQYLNIRIRSREEIKSYLLKKNFSKELIDDVVMRLEKEGYINDELFAKAYVNDRLNLSNDGINKIRRGLTNYKINEDIINKVLDSIDINNFDDKIDKLIKKQINLNTKYTGNILKKRILNYLVNLGYDSDMIIDKLDNYEFKYNGDVQKEYQKLYQKYSKKYTGYKLDMYIKQKLYLMGYDSTDIDNVIK